MAQEVPTATLFDLQHTSYADGPGIRTTVFFKGCNLRCAWCHNPESQAFAPQMMLYRNKCIGCGKCRKVCPRPGEVCTLCGSCIPFCPGDARKICGAVYTPEQVLEYILIDRLFYEATGGGVTFSGGECMLQPAFLSQILRRCKEEGIHTCVDTAGHLPWSDFERVLPFTDLFLFDVKAMDPAKHKAYVGVENHQILSNLARLLEQKHPVWVRYPLIAGINDSPEEARMLRQFYEAHGFPERTEVLPYHTMGESKYPALGKPLQRFAVPSKEALEAFRAVLEP